MISLKNIAKSFQQWSEKIQLYTDLNVEVEKWSFAMLTGQSWSGKTTLFNIIAWLESVDAGQVIVAGNNLQDLSAQERTQRRGENIGFVFQKFHLVPQLTVKENLELPWDISKLPQRYTTEEILAEVDLTRKMKAYPDQLSWGEQQRVAIARAFMYETPLLLADEPTWNLDLWNSEKIMELIKKLQKNTWVTVFMITHEQELLSRADKVFTMSELIR